MTDNLKGLIKYREARSEEKKSRVKSVIKELFDFNEMVNVNAVAKKAAVSRQYLYSHKDLLSLIKETKGPSIVRNHKKAANLKASEKSNDAQLRLIKERHKKLLKENKNLKEEICILQTYIEDLP